MTGLVRIYVGLTQTLFIHMYIHCAYMYIHGYTHTHIYGTIIQGTPHILEHDKSCMYIGLTQTHMYIHCAYMYIHGYTHIILYGTIIHFIQGRLATSIEVPL